MVVFAFSFLISISIISVLFVSDRVKKVIALSSLQSSLILLFLTLGYIKNSRIPVLQDGHLKVYYEHNAHKEHDDDIYTDPVPSVLMLTAIVVGFCISSLGYVFAKKIVEVDSHQFKEDSLSDDAKNEKNAETLKNVDVNDVK